MCDSSLEFMFGPGRAVRARWSGVVICFAHQQPRAETQPAGRGGWPGSSVAGSGSASAGAANVRLGSWVLGQKGDGTKERRPGATNDRISLDCGTCEVLRGQGKRYGAPGKSRGT